jgi:hypothetical protein
VDSENSDNSAKSSKGCKPDAISKTHVEMTGCEFLGLKPRLKLVLCSISGGSFAGSVEVKAGA